MNRIQKIFKEKNKNILSIYFTAGHPELESTVDIIEGLENCGVDMVEIGMPFSDPLADGPVIQDSDQQAIRNGMNLIVLFNQLCKIREKVNIPLLMMGYLNPVVHYGVENFCKKCNEAGIDGIILPDLPLEEYVEHYREIFEKYNLQFIFLITPQTSEERLRIIDNVSNGFIYMVSSSSTTGKKGIFNDTHLKYFERTKALNLKNPLIVGFGITDKDSFNLVCNYANGAIIGTAFVKMLNNNSNWKADIQEFVKNIR